MRPFTLVAAAVLCATALPAIAADRAEIEARYSPTFQPCMDADPSTAGMVQCMAAEKVLSAAILGPPALRPKVEMMSGKMAPMIAAECLPACVPDALGLEPLELLPKLEDA